MEVSRESLTPNTCSVSIYVLALCNSLGITIELSSWDLQNLSTHLLLFPEVFALSPFFLQT